MQRTGWLAAAIAAGWMGVATAQGAGAGGGAGTGAGGGAGSGKDTSSSAGTRTPQGSDMQVGTGTGPRDPGTQSDEVKQQQEATSAGQSATAGAANATRAAGASATLAKLHAGNQAEIQAGKWAQQHATNSKVKDFGKKMVDDHGKLDQDLTKYAQKHDVQLTSAPEYSEAKSMHESSLEQLKGLQGAQLDRQYMQMMVQDHQKDVSEVKTAAQEAKQGKDKEYTKLLENTQKKMEGHLKDAQKISQDLGSRQARQPTSY